MTCGVCWRRMTSSRCKAMEQQCCVNNETAQIRMEMLINGKDERA